MLTTINLQHYIEACYNNSGDCMSQLFLNGTSAQQASH